jgi:hypothetical protein
MGAIKKGRYPGKANSAHGVKWFFKPSLGKVVGRLPGVNRKSDKVMSRNEKIRASPPASKCKNKGPGGTATPWDEFVSCLSAEMSVGVKKK